MNKNNPKDWTKIKEESEVAEASLESTSEKQAEALDHPSYSALEEQLTLKEQESHENWEKAVRAMAELDNVKRRAEKDVSNAHRFGLEKLITALLQPIDSLEQALQAAKNENNQIMIEGLELTMKLILDALAKFEVTQINPEGVIFDPQQHEAMSIQESTEVPGNTVLMVFQKGYKLYDRVIRPARVVVSKNSAAN